MFKHSKCYTRIPLLWQIQSINASLLKSRIHTNITIYPKIFKQTHPNNYALHAVHEAQFPKKTDIHSPENVMRRCRIGIVERYKHIGNKILLIFYPGFFPVLVRVFLCICEQTCLRNNFYAQNSRKCLRRTTLNIYRLRSCTESKYKEA